MSLSVSVHECSIRCAEVEAKGFRTTLARLATRFQTILDSRLASASIGFLFVLRTEYVYSTKDKISQLKSSKKLTKSRQSCLQIKIQVTRIYTIRGFEINTLDGAKELAPGTSH